MVLLNHMLDTHMLIARDENIVRKYLGDWHAEVWTNYDLIISWIQWIDPHT